MQDMMYQVFYVSIACVEYLHFKANFMRILRKLGATDDLAMFVEY